MQAGLQAMPRCSLSYAKIMQTESRDASWLASYAEVQLILCKDIKNMRLRQLLSKKPVVISLFFSSLRQFLMISTFFYLFTFLPFHHLHPRRHERKTINYANCHNKNTPTATTKMRQLPQQKCANCHNENAPTATTKMRQLPQRKRASCHNENAPTATTKTRQLPQRKRANCHNR